MKSQTSLVVKQVRLQQWAELIKKCQSRPTGMNIATWCELNGISKANYYYRLRCVREACLEEVHYQNQEFVELPSPVQNMSEDVIVNKNSISSAPVAILHGKGNISVEILPTATTDFLHVLIGALYHVE